jgi:hypothetical protein
MNFISVYPLSNVICFVYNCLEGGGDFVTEEYINCENEINVLKGIFAFLRGWERQKYSFPSPRVSLGGTRSFLSKNLPEHCTANHGVWIKCIFEQLDRISNVVACLPQAGLPPTPKPTGCVLNCSTMHNYPTLNLSCTITLSSTHYFPEEKLHQPPVWVEQQHCHFPNNEYVNTSSLLSLIWYKLAHRRTNILHKQLGWILLRRVERFLSAEMAPNSHQKMRLYAAARHYRNKSQYTVKIRRHVRIFFYKSRPASCVDPLSCEISYFVHAKESLITVSHPFLKHFHRNYSIHKILTTPS